MNDFQPDEDKIPCIRGCVWPADIEGEAPKPKVARHPIGEGARLCDSCFYRMKYALEAIPDLMANMRLRISPRDGADFIPFGAHAKPAGSPAPLNVAALDKSDALFAKLVSWTELFAEEFETTPPSLVRWMNATETQGFRLVSPAAAHDQSKQLTHWLIARLDRISASPTVAEFHDDLCWGWEDAPGVYNLTGAYGVEPRPVRASEKRECPVCGRMEVFVKWPDTFDPDMAVMCGRCKWVAEPEKYGHYAELFKRAG